MSDQKINQLKSWLDSYLNIARGYLGKPNQHLKLYFMCEPPEVIVIHCSPANFNTLGIQNGEFYYNGPAVGSIIPNLYVMQNGAMTLVSKYENHFNTTLISINPEYVPGKVPEVKAREVVVLSYVSKSGDSLQGPLLMPLNWNPSDERELVPKSYVDTLRRELEARIGSIEARI